MKISNIKQQVKRSERYSIFVDDKYSFSLSELGLINSGLHVGQEVKAGELAKLMDVAQLDKIYGSVLALLSRRSRSEWEIRQYLKRKDSPAPITEEILNKLTKNGMLNDKDFARMWVESRRLLRPTSRRKLVVELRQKRIDDQIIKETLDADNINESDVLQELIARKRKQSRYRDDLKLMQYLARQGFSYSDIKEALEKSQDN